MKKSIALITAIFALGVADYIYATCNVSTNSANCSVTSYSTRIGDYQDFYITPNTDVYFNDIMESRGYPGSAEVSAYTDGSGTTTEDGTSWSKGVYGDYGTRIEDNYIHWVTGGSGFVSLYAGAEQGYAYINAAW